MIIRYLCSRIENERKSVFRKFLSRHLYVRLGMYAHGRTSFRHVRGCFHVRKLLCTFRQ